MRNQRRQFGFTLIEATMAMVLLAIAAAGVLLPFTGAANQHVQGGRQTLAADLASELMEKILAADFDSLVSTYNGYTESKNNLLDAAGQKHTGLAYEGLSRYAICQSSTAASVELITVTVVVLYNGLEITRLTTLAGNHS